MDGKTEETGVVQGKAGSQLAGYQKIRTKLLKAFMVMIALVLAVIGMNFVAQFGQATIEELLEMHGKIANFSLEAEKTLSAMQRYEKEFLFNYERKGIREAKGLYVDPFIVKGGEAYRGLYQMQQLVQTPKDIEVAQKAIDGVNEYLSTFVAVVNILELRVDKEFGELVKLRQSIDNLGTAVTSLGLVPLQNSFILLKGSLQDYALVVSQENTEKVKAAQTALASLVESAVTATPAKAKLVEHLKEFDKWFVEVSKTDGVIAARTANYEQAAERSVRAIQDVLNLTLANQKKVAEDMEETDELYDFIEIGISIFAILVAIFLAFRLSGGLTNQVEHIMRLISEIERGNYKARAKVVSNDELGTMASTLNGMLDNITVLIQSQEERDTIQESIMKLLEEISALTEGDFTGRAEVTEDMTGAIADSFNAMADQFSDIISKVKVATESVDITSDQVARQTMALAQKNMEQVKGVTGAVQAIEQMAQSIREVAGNAQQSAAVSRQSRMNAQEGALAVIETNKAMADIREQINETARSIKRLGESSLEIGNIVQIIDDIADRTSILALNASIQAAMAGEAGHGFAVVADEVQRLADNSSNSTKQIEVLVKSIQNEIKEVSNRIDEGISKVVQGSKLADGAHAKLQEIEKVSNDLAVLIESITEATTGQVHVSETISRTMKDIGEISRESSLSSQDTAASMNVLSKTARDLHSAVEVFKVGETQAL